MSDLEALRDAAIEALKRRDVLDRKPDKAMGGGTVLGAPPYGRPKPDVCPACGFLLRVGNLNVGT